MLRLWLQPPLMCRSTQTLVMSGCHCVWLYGSALTLGLSHLLSRHKGQGVMGFKAFVLELDDDITPHSAKAAYDKYLLDFWGSERIKVFQQKKGNPK